jgi:orotidine-5'-phosphate decarboxylase
MLVINVLDVLGLANPIISPLDFTDLASAERHIATVGVHAGTLKAGSMLIKALGEDVVIGLVGDSPVMWDEKLADIPFQTGGAVRAIVAKAAPRIVTVHASAGSSTVRAAVEAAGPHTLIAAISVLTSISEDECRRIYGTGRSVEKVVLDLAVLAAQAGARALVCSPRELRYLETQEPLVPELGGLYKIVPGIRAEDSPPDDQMRKATPFEAGKWGADLIVVGRLISGADDPAQAILDVTDQYYAGVEAREK